MPKKKIDPSEPDPGAMGYEAWIKGQCKYECAICNQTFAESSKFWSHDDIRNIPPHVYKKKYFTYYALGGRKTQACQMPGCGKKMDWDRSKIELHFKKNHQGTSLSSYYEEYVKNNGTIMATKDKKTDRNAARVKCPTCGKMYSTQNSLTVHFFKYHKKEQKNLSHALRGQNPTEYKLICPEKTCQLRFKVYHSLYVHMRRIHGKNAPIAKQKISKSDPEIHVEIPMVKRKVAKNLIKAKKEDTKKIERHIRGKKEKSPSHPVTKESQEVKDKSGKNAYGAEIMDRGDDVEMNGQNITEGTDNYDEFIKQEEEHILEESSIVTRYTEDETLGLKITDVVGGISL